MRGRPRKHKIIRARFMGYQTWRKGRLAIYELIDATPDHPAGSRVTRNAISLYGVLEVVC